MSEMSFFSRGLQDHEDGKVTEAHKDQRFVSSCLSGAQFTSLWNQIYYKAKRFYCFLSLLGSFRSSWSPRAKGEAAKTQFTVITMTFDCKNTAVYLCRKCYWDRTFFSLQGTMTKVLKGVKGEAVSKTISRRLYSFYSFVSCPIGLELKIMDE